LVATTRDERSGRSTHSRIFPACRTAYPRLYLYTRLPAHCTLQRRYDCYLPILTALPSTAFLTLRCRYHADVQHDPPVSYNPYVTLRFWFAAVPYRLPRILPTRPPPTVQRYHHHHATPATHRAPAPLPHAFTYRFPVITVRYPCAATPHLTRWRSTCFRSCRRPPTPLTRCGYSHYVPFSGKTGGSDVDDRRCRTARLRICRAAGVATYTPTARLFYPPVAVCLVPCVAGRFHTRTVRDVVNVLVILCVGNAQHGPRRAAFTHTRGGGGHCGAACSRWASHFQQRYDCTGTVLPRIKARPVATTFSSRLHLFPLLMITVTGLSFRHRLHILPTSKCWTYTRPQSG